MRDNEICIPCPAKLNLTLAVGAARADGLHPIASVMVPLRFFDTLCLTRLDSHSSEFKRTLAPACPRPSPIDWPIEKDLIYRAHALLESEVGKRLSIKCELSKVIPTGAGLGGGSSNAAGMLVGLRSLFHLEITDKRLVELGMSLGSDVGFAVLACIDHHPRLVTGVGEIIQAIPALPGFDLVLIFPDGVCPTGKVYAAFDARPEHARSAAALSALADDWRDCTDLPQPMNDLAEAAKVVCPAVREAVDQLGGMGLEPELTGSGSTLFVRADSAENAQKIAADAIKHQLPAIVTRFDLSAESA